MTCLACPVSHTRVLQSGLSQSSVLIGQICPGMVRAHGRVVGRVSQRAAVGGGPGREGPVMLRGPHVQTVHRVLAVTQARGGLLVSRVAELQKRRLGPVGRD